MARKRAGELSAAKAVLGLLIERPDTAAALAVRLEEEYPDARWSRSIVHNTLPGLVQRGFAQVTKPGSERAFDWHEATPLGHAHVSEWLSLAVPTLPIVRSSTLAKLRLLRDERQLAVQIENIRHEAELCAETGAKAKHEYDVARRAARLGRAEVAAWQVRRDHALLRHRATFWLSEAKRLHQLANHLEGDQAPVPGIIGPDD